MLFFFIEVLACVTLVSAGVCINVDGVVRAQVHLVVKMNIKGLGLLYSGDVLTEYLTTKAISRARTYVGPDQTKVVPAYFMHFLAVFLST